MEEATAVTATDQVAHHLSLMRIATTTGRLAMASGESPLRRGHSEDDDDDDCIEAIERLGRLEVQCRSGPSLHVHWPERSRCGCGPSGMDLLVRGALCMQVRVTRELRVQTHAARKRCIRRRRAPAPTREARRAVATDGEQTSCEAQ